MNVSAHFKNTILAYLEQRAQDDQLFAVNYCKEGKNIDDCITYILNEVKKSGCNGFADDEIFSMALHYYDEDNIDVGNPVSCHVVVNHAVELTEEEKQEARNKAMLQYQQAELKKLRNKPSAKKEIQAQQSLF